MGIASYLVIKWPLYCFLFALLSKHLQHRMNHIHLSKYSKNQVHGNVHCILLRVGYSYFYHALPQKTQSISKWNQLSPNYHSSCIVVITFLSILCLIYSSTMTSRSFTNQRQCC